MSIFPSSVDERAHNWMLRWVQLGGDLKPANGALEMIVDPARCSIEHAEEMGAMVEEVQASPLLAHGLGRSLLNYYRWEDVQEGRRTSEADA